MAAVDMKGASTSGYGWVIVATSFFTLFFNNSILYAVGVLHMRLVETYPQNEYAVAWLGSILTSLSSLSGPIASLVINLYNCRTCAILGGILGFIGFVGSCFLRGLSWLFVTYALIVGLGFGLSNTSSVVVLGYYFEKDASMAAGIAVTGNGLGMFIHPALTGFLLDTYGLQGTFLILGGLVLQSCVCAMLMRPSQFERRRHVMALSGQTNTQQALNAACGGDYRRLGSIVRHVPFLLLVCSYFSASMALASIYLYLPDYFVQSGATHQVASFSVSMSGIGSIIARILTGFAANDPQIGSLLLLAGITGLSGLSVIFINLLSMTTAGQLTYGLLLGLYSGGTWVICGPITLALLGIENLATAYGLLMMTVGVAYMIGPPLAGLIFQSCNQYYSVFIFCAVLFFASSACSFLTATTHASSKTTVQSATSSKTNVESATSRKQSESEAAATRVDSNLILETNCVRENNTPNFVPELELLVSERPQTT